MLDPATEELKTNYDRVIKLMQDPSSDSDPQILKQLMFTISTLNDMLATKKNVDPVSVASYIHNMEELEALVENTPDGGDYIAKIRHIARLMFRCMTAYIEENELLKQPATEKKNNYIKEEQWVSQKKH